MANELHGKVALVTGASRGIGRATARLLAGHGADVIITARSAPELDSLASEISALGRQSLVVPADVSEEAAVARLQEQALARFSRVDILVNNAGVGKYGPISDLSVADYDWMMDSNMRSSFLCTHAFLPGMLARRQGWIVFVGSVAGLKGLPGEAVYNATKFAQYGFAQSLDYETREQGVKVTYLAPGGVHTYFAFGTGRTEGDPNLEKMMDPETVAEAVLYAVTQPDKARVFLVGLRPMSEPL
jgi:NADP-dependent 3-hydroxy acid dehydrogenase YdfG